MADILIRGIEMPESCYYCPFMIGSWGYSPPHKARCVISGKDMPVDERGVQHDPISCPLIEVPDHGRLIDADEEIEVCTTQGAFPISKTTVSKFLLGHCIGKIPPTVIPASGGEQ